MAAGVSQLQDASWQDRAFIGVKKSGGTVKYFAALTQEIDLPDLSKDFEGQPVMNGGRIRENSAEEDAEITLTIYPIGVLTGSGGSRPEGMAEWFLTDEETAGQRYAPSLDRYDFGVAILWTNVTDSDATIADVTADSEISTKSVDGGSGNVKAALRWVFEDCQITSFNQDFGDMVHTAEVTLKFSPFDETGARNYFNESTQDTTNTTLPTVLGSY